MLLMVLTGGLNGLAVPAALASADECRALTSLTADDLATYEFESADDPWMQLGEGARYTLGSIDIVQQNVFEAPDAWLHRLANRLNAPTRESVVLSVLPIVSGGPVDKRSLAEAERILRNKVYLYDARVIPRQLCGDVLDVFVVTRDVWTLMPRIVLDRSGSENDVGLGISDSNVLGSGKSVSVGYQKDQDRRGVSFAASDPNIAGSRWAADLLVVSNDDGEHLAADVRYPFFALGTRNMVEAGASKYDRQDGLYFLGDEIWKYQADTRLAEVTTGWSAGLEDRFVKRMMVGYGYERYRFDLPADLVAQTGSVPPDREFAYPFIAFERLEDDFDKRVNLDRVQRTEDVALGSRLYAQLGYSSSTTGGSGRYLVGRFEYADATWLTPRQLLSFRAWLDGYYDLEASQTENALAAATLAYRYQHAPRWSLLVRGYAAVIDNPTLDRQLLLGGEEGLRGYPNRYQIGDRSFLITVEERYYSDIYPLQMFRLGGAVFLDTGRAWYEGDAPAWLPPRDGQAFEVLANVGVGLRMESTRTRGDQVLHLDVAFPLRNGPNVRSVEVTFTAKATL